MWVIQQLMNFNIMRNILIILALIMTGAAANAQSVLMEEKVDFYEDLPERGPNRKHYTHGYGSWGVLFGSAENSYIRTNPLFSHYFNLGVRYKRKLSNVYSLGYELEAGSHIFRLAEDEGRSFPDTIHFDKEKVNLYTLGLGLYNRFNFGRRGDYIGNFIDLGVYGEWNFASRYFYKNKYGNDQSRKLSIYNPGYVNTFNYGAFVRAGYNRYVLFARYRLSEIIDTEKGFNDLPPFSVGIQVGFHK